MKKMFMFIFAAVLFAINAGNANAQFFQGETGIGKRINISLNLSGYSPKGGYKELFDETDYVGSKMNFGLSAGHALTEFAEFGVDFNHYGSFYAYNVFYMFDKLTWSCQSFSAYAKINFINELLSSDISLQSYIKASYGRIYEDQSYSYMGEKITSNDNFLYYSYGAGIDFSLGPNKNLIIGAEYRMHNDDDGKFASSLGINIGCRFDKVLSFASNNIE